MNKNIMFVTSGGPDFFHFSSYLNLLRYFSNLRISIRYLSLMLVFLLSGCGATHSVKFSADPRTEITTFTFLDERPILQKQSRDEDGSDGRNHFYGDDSLNPTGAELVKTVLHHKMGPELAGKTIILTDFVISTYVPVVEAVDPDRLNASASAVPNGYAVAPLAELLILAIEGAKVEKNVLVQISGTIDQISFSSNVSENFKGRVTEGNIRDTVEKVLDDVISQIKSIVAASRSS